MEDTSAGLETNRRVAELMKPFIELLLLRYLYAFGQQTD